MERPGTSDYHAFYETYVGKVPDGDIFEILKAGVRETSELLQGVPEDWGGHRYAEGKWSVREVLGHMIDTEWVFCYRALAMARGEAADLPSMDENEYASASNADQRSLVDLLHEFRSVRQASLALFSGIAPQDTTRQGHANGLPFIVRAFPWIVAGHEIHHRGVLRERYLEPLQTGSAG